MTHFGPEPIFCVFLADHNVDTAMISTRQITPRKKELFRFMIIRYVRKKWWLLVLAVGVGVLSSLNTREGDYSFLATIFFFLIFLPVAISLSIWHYLGSKNNKVFYLSRYFEIGADTIKNILEDGSVSSIKLANFIKSERIGGFYLLYTSKTQYFMIPENSFKSPEDLRWFELHILDKISMPGFL